MKYPALNILSFSIRPLGPCYMFKERRLCNWPIKCKDCEHNENYDPDEDMRQADFERERYKECEKEDREDNQ